KPFLVASSARALMAQRPVRRVCRRCGAPHVPSEAELRTLNIDPNSVGNATFMKGKGCGECNKTGYRGRFGIFEIFVVDDEIRKLIYDKVPSSELRSRAREVGMRTLREDGARKVLAGLTSPEEVIRATLGDLDWRNAGLLAEGELCRIPCLICCSWSWPKARPTCICVSAFRPSSAFMGCCTGWKGRR